jgi:hypothetical protein
MCTQQRAGKHLGEREPFKPFPKPHHGPFTAFNKEEISESRVLIA